MDLFGEEPAPAPAKPAPEPKPPRAKGIPAAEPNSGLIALADTLHARYGGRLRLGTSSWYFPGWAGFVWSPAAREASEQKVSREGLRAYAQHPLLQSVSLDRAFYTPMTASDYARYANQVGPGFRFTSKCWRGITDPVIEGTPNPLFMHGDYAREQILQPFLDGAGVKAGVQVLQFSPGLPRRARLTPRSFAERLNAFLAALASPIPVVVELRDAALLTPDYFAVLRRHGAEHCINVHPKSGVSVIEQAKLIGRRPEPLVIRWMLHAGFEYEEARERYSPFDKLVDEDPATRRAVARLARRALDAGGTVYVIAIWIRHCRIQINDDHGLLSRRRRSLGQWRGQWSQRNLRRGGPGADSTTRPRAARP